jgi:serine/threonine protein kinase/tetratricopeptide (TPR) repeat protein
MGIGDVVSHYRILGKLGEGGMGVVWKAEDVHMQRVVALKFLHASEDLARLLREAQTAGSLNHPNICTVHEVDPERGFLAMELVEGRTLKDIIGGRPVPVNEALRVAVRVGEGLAAAHAKGIVHRDIKPANIMVTAPGLVKIMDFGLARVAGQQGLTLEGAAAGTPGYMAPEQMRGESVDRRTDIWAFGAVLHEMLTGRPPTGQTDTLPEGLGRSVRKALAADPGERYQHIEDLLVDLRKWQAPAPSRRGWLWTAAGASAAAGTGIAVWLSRHIRDTGIRSIAVLPLANLSKDPEQDYFVDGLHEEITALLSRVSGLKVISRTSTIRYKNEPKPAPEIGRELKVEGLLEGSVRRVGDEVAITLQLIRAATDEHLWAETYRRNMVNILALQAETARAAVRAIGVALKPAERKALAAARQVNPAAYQAYLRGQQFWHSFPKPSAPMEARQWYERAIQLDPTFAQPYIGIGKTYLAQSSRLFEPRDALLKAEEYGAKAVALDPTPEARYAMVNPRGWRTYDWRTTYQVAQEWLATDPNSADAYHIMAAFYVLCFTGRQEDAIRHARKAVELDPFSLFYDDGLGRTYYFARRYDEALAHMSGLATRHPENPEARERDARLRAIIHALRGNIDEARRALDEMRSKPELLHVPALVKVGRIKQAREMLAEAERDYAAGRPIFRCGIAIAHLYAGEKEQAFRWLDIALNDLEPVTMYLNVWPMWDPIRGDPRFQAAVRRRFGEMTER